MKAYSFAKSRKRYRGISGRRRVEFKKRLLKKSDGKCPFCKKEWVFELNHPQYPSLDHIIPHSHGGSHNISNIQLVCIRCNTEKDSLVGDQLTRWLEKKRKK